MKDKTSYVSILAIILVFAATQVYAQGMGPGMMGGMGRGYGMGPGMMNRGWGIGQQYDSQYGPKYQGPQYEQPRISLGEKDAEGLLEDYLQSTRNPNLKLGRIEDEGNHFEAEVQTKDGSLVDRMVVDKRTGSLRSIY